MNEIRALTFDTGGTVLDWHGGLSRALAAVAGRSGLSADWGAVVNEYRRRSLGAKVNQRGPTFNLEDVHRHQHERDVQD